MFKVWNVSLFIFVGIFLLISLTFAQQAKQCQVARPWFGSINCKLKEQWSDTPIQLSNNDIYPCQTPACKITELTQTGWECPFGSVKHGVDIKNADTGNLIFSCSKTGGGDITCANIPYEFQSPQKIKVIFWCEILGGNKVNPTSGNLKVAVVYRPIALELNYDSGHNFIAGTEQCKIDEVYNEYFSKQPQDPNKIQSISSNIQTNLFTQNSGSMIPGNTLGILQPKDLQVDQGYWLVYDWVTRPDLIVSYTKDNIPVWCNVVDHSLTKFEEITTQSQSCYFIPTQRLSQTVECCSSDECKLSYSDQAVQCTNDFKCGYEKSCLSDFDCGGVASTCEISSGKYFLTKSTCDKSKLDSYGKGKCVSNKEEVSCCTGQDGGPNSCGSGNFCDYSKGCQAILQSCPAGSCCKAGGQYIPQECSAGLMCCISSTSFIGECKSSCQPTTTTQISGNTTTTTLFDWTGNSALIGSLIVGVIAVAGVVGYIIWKNKQEEEPISGKKKGKDLLGGDI